MSNLTIYKSNDLVEAGYRLSLAEQRLVVLSLGQLDSRNPKQKHVTLYAKDYAKQWGVNEDNAMREINQASKRLFERYITLKNDDETRKFRWIQESVEHHKGEGRVSFTFSDRILPFLFELDFKLGVTKYELLSVSGFSSVYSFRLYELAIKLFGMKNQTVELGELRRILQLENKYSEYKEFNKFVLKPSLFDINEKSDLLLNIEPVKRGRKIVALEFQIAKKAKAKKDEPTSDGTRKIHGVFEEKNRPQVIKGSQAETDWVNENYARAVKQMREEGILKSRFIEDELSKLPTEWLKVVKKYASVINRPLSREISDELHKRKS
ncbi:replication initiation protein [Actinobacillus seminis]|uniref:replication initiation protein n=1 Tax=Actinobacillus seminis TaxID=722 RepID=UPI003B93FEB0